jgi:hypothetical protein
VITPSQFLFFAPYSINKDYVWLQAHKFTILVYRSLPHYLIFLFVVFITIVFCSISYLTRSLLGLYFPIPLPLPLNLSKFTLVFDYVLVDSNPFEFFHYHFCAFCNMATFHTPRCLDLTIMVDDLGTTVVSKHCLCAMFIFQPHSLHIFKDV